MEHQVDASEVMCLFTPIMQSIEAKIDGQLVRNQVTGKDAAQVYLHALESTLHEVVLLILGADQRKLILAQTGKENAGTNLVIQQTENAALEGDNIPKQGAILDQDLLKLIGETNLLPKQGNLIDAQVAKENVGTSYTTQQTYNLGLEALNVPKQGAQIDQQTAKLLGETNLIPKQSQLMDAQIVHLLRENEKLELEKAILSIQGDNLAIEGTNLGKQTELITEQIKAMKEDVAGKAMDVKVKGTQAELNRAQAYKVAAEQAAIQGRAYAEILSVMVGSYNTAIAHSLDLASAFDNSAINSVADSAMTALQNTVNIVTFV